MPLPVPPVTRPGVVLPVPVDPTGVAGPTRGQARGRKWRKAGPGLYVPAAVDSTELSQRIVEAASGVPAGAAVTGWAALGWSRPRWFNGRGPDGESLLPVPVALGDQRTLAPRVGVRWSNDWLFDDDVVAVDGLPITVPCRSVTYEVRRTRSLVRAAQVISMAAAEDLVALEELATYLVRLGPRGGTRLLRRALPVASENAWSPQEITMLLVWQLEGGRRRPELNVPVFDRSGNHLLTPDLLDATAGVAGEYDGAVHLEGTPRRRDLNREALCRDLGIELVTMMSVDRHDTQDFLRRLQAAYRRVARRVGEPRGWTTEQPAWWVDTSTVAARRALSDTQRALWLRRAS